MTFGTRLLALALVLPAVASVTPALAASAASLPPCQGKGGEAVAMPFPRGDASDLTLARAMLPAVARGLSYKPAPPTCSRGTVRTAIGELVLGGEDANLFPRFASRVDGKAGAYALVVKEVGSSPNPTYALVIAGKDGSVAAHRFYAGMPSDAALLADLVEAASEPGYILAQRRMPGGSPDKPAIMVLYGFDPPPGGPPPAQSADSGDGVARHTGPQFMIGDGSQSYLDLVTRGGVLIHRPSGRSCPQSLIGGAILLQQADATDRSLLCSYREGPDLAFKADAHIKYRLLITKERGSVAAVMKDLTASARKALPIVGDKAAPLAAGAAPQPQAASFWTLTDGSVQGVWLGKAGGWMTRLQVDYPDSPANDAQARTVAEALFAPSDADVAARP